MDAYSLYDLDGTNKVLPAALITNQGQVFKPTLIYVDHKLKTKQLKGQTEANEANNSEQTFYGWARGPGGKRIFRMLYQQWAPNPDGSYDTAVSVAEGDCQALNIGGGRSGYYAPTLVSQGWRMDGWFSGPPGPFQDGLRLKYLSASSSLVLPVVRAVNDQALNLSQAFAYVLENIFPNYTELSPDIR